MWEAGGMWVVGGWGGEWWISAADCHGYSLTLAAVSPHTILPWGLLGARESRT